MMAVLGRPNRALCGQVLFAVDSIIAYEALNWQSNMVSHHGANRTKLVLLSGEAGISFDDGFNSN
jgi:hypothetical protein